jgi:hypothetical protein
MNIQLRWPCVNYSPYSAFLLAKDCIPAPCSPMPLWLVRDFRIHNSIAIVTQEGGGRHCMTNLITTEPLVVRRPGASPPAPRPTFPLQRGKVGKRRRPAVALTNARELGLAEQWKHIIKPFPCGKGGTRPRPTPKQTTYVCRS